MEKKEEKIFRVYWTYLGGECHGYVKAANPEEAIKRFKKNLLPQCEITCIMEVKEHQICGVYDICVNFKNPVLDREPSFG